MQYLVRLDCDTVALRTVNEVSYVTRMNYACHFRGRRSIWSGWRVTPVAPRIVNEV